MVNIRLFLILCCLSGLSLMVQGQQPYGSPLQMKESVTYLASEDLGGRKSGTPGDSLAAVYIRKMFSEQGARLMGNNGFQYFGVISDVRSGNHNQLTVNDHPYVQSIDFEPFSFSSNATVNADVVFAGFGLSGNSGDLRWDDFEGKDIKGKWVIVLRGDPEPDNQNSAFIPMATDRAKALAVRDLGGAGLLLVSPSSIEKKDVPVEISYDKTIADAGIPVISITRKVAAEIMNVEPQLIDSLEKQMIRVKKPLNHLTTASIEATTDIVREKVTTRNIIAMIPGNDPVLKNEYIVIGAHYDHLGMGGPGSGSRVPDEHAVHGGADDNASGVVALISLISHFSQEKNRTPRSLIFVSFGAEEMGLLGSRYFTANSPVELKSVKAMVNLDMVGRLSVENPVVTVSGTGTFSLADTLVDRLAALRKFQVRKSPDGFGPSDHAAFYGEGIPVLFLTSGAHEDYHTPADVASKLNYEGLNSITEFAGDLVAGLAALNPAPVFTESGSSRTGGHRYGRGLKVTLGIMPDVSGAETSGGMKVEGTRKDGPAFKAGMIKGDIITAINGLPVGNIYDYMSRMGKLKPGERVNVEVLRDGKKEILIIEL